MNTAFKATPITLPCGNRAVFDVESEMGYRCTTCYAMFGSVSMPKECKILYDMEKVVDKLKGD